MNVRSMGYFKNRLTRSIVFLIGDTGLVILSATVSWFLLNRLIEASQLPFPLLDTLIFSGVAVYLLALSGMYNINWRFVSLHELVRIAKSLSISLGVYLVVGWLLHGPTVYYPVFIFITFTLSLLLIGSFRISKRLVLEVILRPKSTDGVVIYGAGNAGEQIIRDIQRNNDWKLKIEGIFDDNSSLWGTSIHDIPVRGGRENLVSYLKGGSVRELIIAAPSMPKNELKKILETVRSVQPRQLIKVLPAIYRHNGQSISIKNVRDIRLEDILGRETAEIDFSVIESGISGKRILITGAGGSIGSEMVRQLTKFSPASIVALDIDETELFYLEQECIGSQSMAMVKSCVADITDRDRMERIFQQEQPEIVYHAAAYKHVPMMERHPEEAVRVNVGGTRIVSELAANHGVEKFIFVSSDKAVNPANVMGATKRVSEQICMSFNDHSETRFLSVRFGNVLGSRGSVVPLFVEQIKKGGPVTITHPDVKRYFMTIPEAVLLVAQAGVMGSGGEVFVLDMGEPVKIVDMAHQLIRLHGLEPEKDIPIIYKGLRPGEKLFEELLNTDEGNEKTDHPLVYKAECHRPFTNGRLDAAVGHLLQVASIGTHHEIREALKILVPTYTWNGNGIAPGLSSTTTDSSQVEPVQNQKFPATISR